MSTSHYDTKSKLLKLISVIDGFLSNWNEDPQRNFVAAQANPLCVGFKASDMKEMDKLKITKCDANILSHQGNAKEVTVGIGTSMTQAIEDHVNYAKFTEEKINDFESSLCSSSPASPSSSSHSSSLSSPSSSKARDTLKKLVKESDEKKGEYVKYLSLAEAAIKEGRDMPDELVKFITSKQFIIANYSKLLR